MDKNQLEILEKFLSLEVSDYYRTNVLGEKNFQEILDDLNVNVIGLLKNSIKISLTNGINIPRRISSKLYEFSSNILHYLKQIEEYRFDNETSNDFSKRNTIIGTINNFIEKCYSTSQSNGFLETVTVVKTFYDNVYEKTKSEIREIKDSYEKALTELPEKTKQVEEILEELQKKATEESLEDFAQIFHQESDKYSSNNIFKPKTAEWWFWFSIGVSGSLIIILAFLFPDIQFHTNSSIDISKVLLKFTILFILVYLIRFGFKHYSINKHLHAMNRHRANVLNSFKLLISSVDDSNVDVRNTIVMEVSKAIYESGKTGYIEDKSDDGSSPSIIEMTRVLSSKQN